MTSIETKPTTPDTPPRPPKSGQNWRKRWPFAAAAVAILVVIGLLWLVFSPEPDPEPDPPGPHPAGEVLVPPVVGKPEADARALLEEKGLQVETRQEDAPRVGTGGLVVSQSPGGLTRMSAGGTVTLVVGREPDTPPPTPPPPVVMPSVVDASVESAVGTLRSTGLVVSILPAVDSRYGMGRIAQQSPAPGTSLPSGTGVSVAPATGFTTVPNVAGMCLVQAKSALEAAGLRLGTTTLNLFATIIRYAPAEWAKAAQTRVQAGSTTGRAAVQAEFPVTTFMDPGCPTS